jgi:hypothetical protein
VQGERVYFLLFFISGALKTVWCILGHIMKITIDGRGFVLEERKMLQNIAGVHKVMKQHVLRQSRITQRRIKIEMPVDTGRARSSWGNLYPNNVFSELGDGIWEVSNAGLTILQGTNVPYVVYLNEGWSSQAGAGFIDAAEVAARKQLASDLGRALVWWWGRI